MQIITIDFEASCLPRHGRSFPIEVGIASSAGARSWLIAPDPAWADWDWTAQAQALHGLTREQVAQVGRPAAAVLAELRAAVGADARIVADSLIDQYWLDLLAQAAGEPRPFRIDHVSMILDERLVGEAAIARAVSWADGIVAQRHRAGEDARWLHAFIEALDAAPPMPAPGHGQWSQSAALGAA